MRLLCKSHCRRARRDSTRCARPIRGRSRRPPSWRSLSRPPAAPPRERLPIEHPRRSLRAGRTVPIADQLGRPSRCTPPTIRTIRARSTTASEPPGIAPYQASRRVAPSTPPASHDAWPSSSTSIEPEPSVMSGRMGPIPRSTVASARRSCLWCSLPSRGRSPRGSTSSYRHASECLTSDGRLQITKHVPDWCRPRSAWMISARARASDHTRPC